MSDNQKRIQELYNELKESEKRKKDLNKVIKDAYNNYSEYQEILDEMDKLRTRKKEVESAVKQEYSSEYNDLESIKLDIKDTKMMLSDLMWNEIMKNNNVEVTDEYDTKYIPNVVVTLKKAD